MLDIFFNPRQFFLRLNNFNISRTFVCYSMIILSISVLLLAYFRLVNFSWLQAQLITRLDDEQRKIALKVLSPSVLLVSSIAGRCVKMTLWFGLLSFVYDVLGKSFRCQRSFAEWLQLVVFSNLPIIAILPLGLLAMSLSPSVTILPGQLDTTSLAFLTSSATASRWDSVLAQLSIVQFWIVAIQAVGLSTWLQIGIGRALVLAAAPYLACMGITAALVLL